jgi:membrane-bound lytic murein transglycosylase D
MQSGSFVSLKPDTVCRSAAVPLVPGDTEVNADSFVDKYGTDVPNAPECSEIDFLLESAKSACKADSFGEAHVLLRKALVSIKEKEEDDRSWPDAENYSNEVARVYAEEMPPEYADSIPDEISMLVFQKQLSKSLDTLKLSHGDSIVLKKLACQKGISYNFPIPWNDKVYRSLCFFARSKKGSLDKWLTRAAYYQPFMRRMFADSGLPTDLSYLPLIESGFEPCAYSRRHASGMWQFIASTGTRYGLRNNYWIDERRDPVQSTTAAIGYLKKLYNQFGDWQLAIAAYNCGENGVAGALGKSSSSSFWRLYLPRETRNYVPEFISAIIVAKNPECFGYALAHSDTFDLDTMLIDECINIQSVADSLRIPATDLRAMNPHLLHWCTPPALSQIHLYLPKGLKPRLAQALTRHPEAFKVVWYGYQVKPGEKLSTIARQFKVPLEAVKSINGFDDVCRLAEGQQLLIPIPIHMSTAQAYAIAEDLKHNESSEAQKPGKNGLVRYRVRSGDTVWELASLFRVSAGDICAWNNLADQRIKAGQCLVLHTGKTRATATVTPSVSSPPARQGSSFAKYQVVRGETLFAISRKLSVSVSDLITWNGMDSNNPVIFAGQNLLYEREHRVIARSRQPDTLFYRVCKGDNLYSLASSFSVTVNDIRHANNLAPSSVIKTGDLIRIPVSKRISSAASKSYPATVASNEEHP